MWIIDNQLARRNINRETRADLLGRRYLVENKGHGGNRKSTSRNDQLKWTNQKIAEQSNTSAKTIQRAAEYSKAIGKLITNTGIKRRELSKKRYI